MVEKNNTYQNGFKNKNLSETVKISCLEVQKEVLVMISEYEKNVVAKINKKPFYQISESDILKSFDNSNFLLKIIYYKRNREDELFLEYINKNIDLKVGAINSYYNRLLEREKLDYTDRLDDYKELTEKFHIIFHPFEYITKVNIVYYLLYTITLFIFVKTFILILSFLCSLKNIKTMSFKIIKDKFLKKDTLLVNCVLIFCTFLFKNYIYLVQMLDL